MKNLKRVNLLIPGMFFILLTLALGCQKETVAYESDILHLNPDKTTTLFNNADAVTTDESGRTVITTNDLSALFINGETAKNDAGKGCPDATSGEGFPINGCKDFTVGISIAGWIYAETSITVCCACAVCGVYLENSQNQQKSIKGSGTITINTSSSVMYGNYEISIAPGNYTINKEGELLDVRYNVVITE